MPLSGRLLVLLAVALLAISIAEHKVFASRTEELQHRDNLYKVNKGGEGSLHQDECRPECNRRCSHTQYHKACITYCNKCCNKCLCVPSGFYGHKEECPCYNNWKTQEGGPKCP